MYFVFVIVLSLFALILQTAFFSVIQIKGAKPDLILIILTYLSLLKGAEAGSIFGFSFGLLQDVLSGMFLGSNALTKTLLGFTLGSIGKKLYVSSLLQMIFVFVVTFVNETLLSGLTLMLKAYSTQEVITHWIRVTPTESIYNSFLCPFIVLLLRFGERNFGLPQQ